MTRDVVIRYLQLIEAMDLDGVAALIHPAIEVIEHPNKLNPTGKRMDAAALRAAGEPGQAMMAKQRYAIRHLIVDGDRACAVLEAEDGKIRRQEQFDCFPA